MGAILACTISRQRNDVRRLILALSGLLRFSLKTPKEKIITLSKGYTPSQ